MLCFKGESKTRKRAPDHPSPARDMTSVYDTGCGKRKRFGAKGVTTRSMARAASVEGISSQLYKLRDQQRKQPWRNISLSIKEERRGVDANGKSVQVLPSQLQSVPKGTGQVPQPCIVRSIAPSRGRLSTFATAIIMKEGSYDTSSTTINSTASCTWTHRRL